MRFLSVYRDLKTKGALTSPRGHKCIEIQDYMFTMGPRDRFTSYNARKFNLDYAKFEMMWYLTGDNSNSSIIQSASMWEDLRQKDGTWYSNYGQYWFEGPHFGMNWVLDQLFKDEHTRQAVIPMLSRQHLWNGNKDVVCTESISFRIRNDKLFMSVNMRSQDAMWGLTNDAFCFSILHEMVYVMLRDGKYYDLEMGSYTHKVDSFHVYERHFDMLDNILDESAEGYYVIVCPKIHDSLEVVNLIHRSKEDRSPDHRFTEWLYDNRYSNE